jgi:hypothetical protein
VVDQQAAERYEPPGEWGRRLGTDPEDRTLTVRLHRWSRAMHDAALEHLGAAPTATEAVFPGTELRLIFEPVGSTSLPRDQES